MGPNGGAVPPLPAAPASDAPAAAPPRELPGSDAPAAAPPRERPAWALAQQGVSCVFDNNLIFIPAAACRDGVRLQRGDCVSVQFAPGCSAVDAAWLLPPEGDAEGSSMWEVALVARPAICLTDGLQTDAAERWQGSKGWQDRVGCDEVHRTRAALESGRRGRHLQMWAGGLTPGLEEAVAHQRAFRSSRPEGCPRERCPRRFLKHSRTGGDRRCDGYDRYLCDHPRCSRCGQCSAACQPDRVCARCTCDFCVFKPKDAYADFVVFRAGGRDFTRRDMATPLSDAGMSAESLVDLIALPYATDVSAPAMDGPLTLFVHASSLGQLQPQCIEVAADATLGGLAARAALACGLRLPRLPQQRRKPSVRYLPTDFS
eukprot:TRINITY_DN2544_c0_g1_i2.p1 TRINITY_DN2544_c0_g1~~TRINITY_DN2544_c0_g1_i2.p1  ORF type:complete len:398 (+),score=88.96 TRINITY_DN2544_c0_g1_i2:78-1196(+)